MMKQAEIYMRDKLAGILTEDASGFIYQYNSDYLHDSDAFEIARFIFQNHILEIP